MYTGNKELCLYRCRESTTYELQIFCDNIIVPLRKNNKQFIKNNNRAKRTSIELIQYY